MTISNLSDEERLEKFSWKEGDIKIIKGDWTLSVKGTDGSLRLVQTWADLQEYLLQTDAGAKYNPKAAFYRFLRHNPQRKYMPENLTAELRALDLLP